MSLMVFTLWHIMAAVRFIFTTVVVYALVILRDSTTSVTNDWNKLRRHGGSERASEVRKSGNRYQLIRLTIVSCDNMEFRAICAIAILFIMEQDTYNRNIAYLSRALLECD